MHLVNRVPENGLLGCETILKAGLLGHRGGIGERKINARGAENLIRKTDGGLGAGKAGIGSAVIQSLANLDGRKSGSQGGFHLLLESIKILAGRQRYQGHQHAQAVAERAA